MPKLILTHFKSEKVAQFRLGGRAAQNDFDTFYLKGENKSEKFPKLRAGGGDLILAMPKRKGVFFMGSLS